MTVIPTVLSVAAGICLFAGIMHLLFGLARHPRDWTHISFALASLAIAANTLSVLAIHTSGSVDAYVTAFKYAFGPTALLINVGILGFVAFYAGVRPRWFLLAMIAWFTGIVGLQLVLPYGILFADVSGLRSITMPWGEQFVIAQATPHPWRLAVDLFFLVFFGFLLYATYRQYRRGDRGRASVLAVAIFLFLLSIVFDSLVDTGVINSVYISEIVYLGFVVVMSFLLYSEVIQTESELRQYRLKLEAMVDERTTELQHTNDQLAREIADRMQIEKVLQQVAHERGERVKELNCLFGISDLAGRRDISLDEILQGTAELIPTAWQNPETSAARIVLEDREFKTEHFQETPLRLARDLVVSGQPAGVVEVCLLEEPPAQDGGPFLPEEQRLLDAIAERLGRIVERLRARDALQEREQRFRALYQGTPVSITVWQRSDDDFRLVDNNDAAKEMTQGRIADLIGITASELHSDRPDIVADIAQCFATQTSIQREMTYRFKTTGESKVLVVTHAFVPPDLVLSHSQDITERKRAEEGQRQSERTARALINAPPDSAFLLDPQGLILDFNEVAAVRLGVSVEEVKGRNAFDLFEPRIRAARRAKLANAVTNKRPVRWQDTRADYVFDNTFYPILDDQGEVTSVAAFAADITEQVRAEQVLQQRVEELAALSRISHTVATATELPAALQQVSENVTALFAARYAHVIWAEGEEGENYIQVGYEPGSGPISPAPLDLPLGELPVVDRVLREAMAQIIPDVRSLPLSDLVRGFLEQRNIRSVMLIPLVIRGAAVGLLSVASDQPGRLFGASDVRLAETIATDLAAAIESARLFEQAQAAAAAEERSRLARDLHDAVTQTIYSATLIVEALPRVWERNPDEGRRNLVKLRQLVRGALAEMRTLLFELRPTALQAADLSTLLHYLGDALTGRTRIPMEVVAEEAAEGEIELPPEAKVALYRITQEAFNNIAKHARATRAGVTLHRGPDQVILTIRDNGRGFDPDSVPAARLGLNIMRERAEGVGAALTIDSEPGKGTRLAVSWTADHGRQTTNE